MFNDSMTFYIITAIGAFIIGLSKGGLGGMLGALVTPMMSLVIPVNEAVGVILPILIYADLFAVTFHWRRWEMRFILLLLPGTVSGVVIGTVFIANAPTEALQTFLGIIVTLFAIFKLMEKRILGTLKYESRIGMDC